MPPRPPLTHFLCIPLLTEASRPNLQASIQHFTSDITTPAVKPTQTNTEASFSSSTTHPPAAPAQGGTTPTIPLFPPSAIRPLTTLHLTLGVMSLPTPTRVTAATDLLASIDLATLLALATSPTEAPPPPSLHTSTANTNIHASTPPSPPPLSLSLHSLHPLPTAQNASILYATPHDETRRLYPFCTALRALFEEAGFILPEKRALLLHCTIVNTVYARVGNGLGGSGRRGRGGRERRDRGQGKFDAREVVAMYDGFEWMRGCRVERVGICEMGARVVGGEVRYAEVAGREMP